MTYIDDILQQTVQENPGQVTFHQAVREVLMGIVPAVKKHETLYRRQALLERLTRPERLIRFRVSWEDDRGNLQVNTGWRVQWNGALGPYKGGLRFHPSVTTGTMQFLAFEQTFKNALTGLPLGGGKGGSDFDPKGKSDGEIGRFCRSFMTQLYRFIGPYRDVPAGDIGVGQRELGYLFGQYRALTGAFPAGAITGKGLSWGGCPGRGEATGYGLLYLTQSLLQDHGMEIEGKRVAVSGAGNVALHAMEKAVQLGAIPVTCSDSTGWLLDMDGLDTAYIKEIKSRRQPLEAYTDLYPKATFQRNRDLWQTPCDIALPCATENELTLSDARVLTQNGCKALCEGANMPCTREAAHHFLLSGTLYCPGKAANAGGVAVSGIEMQQNARHCVFPFAKTDALLKGIMENIYRTICQAAKEFDREGDLLSGANIAGFLKVADAMLAQGCI